ncbi:YcaO-like family protein [Streptomyces lavendulae]|uniref:YcaO-like family protein n=1 Tax=Streptomyces lavendulae TaxID=1914 RepID=UPI0036B33C72
MATTQVLGNAGDITTDTPTIPLDFPEDSYGERSLDAETTARKLARTLLALRLEPELAGSGGEPTRWGCVLREDDGTTAGTGSGKGPSRPARIGAVFEALEHYGLAHPAPGRISLRPAREVTTSGLAADPAVSVMAALPDAPLACLTYTSLLDRSRSPGPLWLCSPQYLAPESRSDREAAGDHYDYRPLIRYSTSNGCAIGCDEQEAAVHALNEAVERDALSLFLIGTFLHPNPQVTLLDRTTLPAHLQNLTRRVESRLGTEVHLIDITSDLGIPTFLAYATPLSNGIPRFGSGTSLSAEHALYRACTELVEISLEHETGRAEDFRATLDCLGDHPPLRACAEMDLDGLVGRSPAEPFTPTPAPRTPSQHLAQIVRTLGARGFDPHVTTLRNLPEGIVVCHTIVPGLERFFGVCDGHPMPPGARGMSYLQGLAAG